MNFAVIGSGGREHSICFKLKQSPKIKRLICIPGNAGTNEIAENINIDINKFDEILTVIKKFEIDVDEVNSVRSFHLFTRNWETSSCTQCEWSKRRSSQLKYGESRSWHR